MGSNTILEITQWRLEKAYKYRTFLWLREVMRIDGDLQSNQMLANWLITMTISSVMFEMEVFNQLH